MGTLTNLEFDVVGAPAQTSVLSFVTARLNDGAITPATVNGSVTINVGYTLAGRVSYWADSSRSVAGATLTLEGGGTMTTTSSADGTFQFASLSNVAYNLTPSKTTQVDSISAYDAALVLQHAAGLTTLTGQAARAADVNLNDSITAMDAYHILRQASGAEAITVPGGGRAWLFTPVNRTFTTLTANQTGQDFTAVLLGDVSGNWQTTTGQSGATVKTALATVTDAAADRTYVLSAPTGGRGAGAWHRRRVDLCGGPDTRRLHHRDGHQQQHQPGDSRHHSRSPGEGRRPDRQPPAFGHRLRRHRQPGRYPSRASA